MTISIRRFPTWATALLLAALSLAAYASPFVGSKSDAHGTLLMNMDQRAKQIYPVNVWAVDGKLTNRANQGVLWVAPGEYTFSVKVSPEVNLADIPGLQRNASYGQDIHELKVTVEAGKDYYIGAKFSASGKWEPVIWKTEADKN
jgi:hypothetical protein